LREEGPAKFPSLYDCFETKSGSPSSISFMSLKSHTTRVHVRFAAESGQIVKHLGTSALCQ
jgi:hypothetical protein